MEGSLYQIIIFVSDGTEVLRATHLRMRIRLGSTKRVPKNSVLIVFLPCFFYLWSGSSEGRNKNMNFPCIAIHEGL